MKKNYKLYNIFFPIWILWLIPTTWIFAIPINFVFDFFVLYFTIKLLKLENPFSKSKKSIISVFISGFIADFIGSVLLIILATSGYLNSAWSDYLFENPFLSVQSFLLMLFFVIISAICIYFLNYRFSFRKIDIDNKDRKKICLSLAIFTAPYFFFLPTEIVYNILSII
ncbi:MAG: hypothetical protein RR561_00105 [Peptostreptococcus sp.]|uniref:hypothetical protein n=1 Tax=Peptostreptococcus sp. TaxID=1262 RepID=UPI002FCBF30C